MFFSKKDSSKPPAKTPVWFKWLIFGFIGFAFLNQFVDPAPESPQSVQAAKDLSNQIKQTRDQFLPQLVDGISVQQETVGKGAVVQCGQEVELTYSSSAQPNGTDIENVTTPHITLFGSGALLPALTQSLEGMRVGGSRTVLAASKLAYDADGFAREGVAPATSIILQVTLLAARGEPKPVKVPMRMFTVKEGEGAPLRCGDKARVSLTVTRPDGTPVFTSGTKPVEWNVGDGRMPFGIEKALLSAPRGTAKTLILPPAYQAPLAGNKKSLIVWPQGEAVIVDIQLL